MPAPTRRAASTRASLADRRRTSLEGGNRGGWRCGWVSLQGYGNLKGRNRVERGDLADQADGDIALMPCRWFGDAGLFGDVSGKKRAHSRERPSRPLSALDVETN